MPNSSTPVVPRVHVAVGVIKNNRQQVLIAKRAAHLHQGGFWEFPGGKVEKNETVQQALARELHEELGIVVEVAQPFIKITHDYPDKSVLLDVWLVEQFTGQPQSRESQPLLWVGIDELKNYAVPQANVAIVRMLEDRARPMQEEILITGHYRDPDDYVTKLQHALNKQVKWVHLRSHASQYQDYQALYALTAKACQDHAVQLTLNTSLDWFHSLQAENLHFTSARLLSCRERPVGAAVLFGASCHNLAELQHAESIGADYIMLGPVFKTATHPTQEPIGLDKFSTWAKQTTLPVFALGGVSPETKAIIKKAGAYGWAGISSYWR